MSESSVTTCPQCSQEAFAKMLSAPSFQLSGSGWYASDFKDKKTSANSINAKNSESTAVTTEAKTATTDTKPAVCNPGCACH